MVLGKQRVQDGAHQTGRGSVSGVRKKAKGPKGGVTKHDVPDCSQDQNDDSQMPPIPEPGEADMEDAPAEKRCFFPGCKGAEEGQELHSICEGCTEGGQDWSSLIGRVMCHSCYEWFKEVGILEMTGKGLMVETAKRCMYELCERPDKSRHFYQIDQGTAAGGRDWSSLVGRVLCQACYERFTNKGTLERTNNKPLASSARRCMYEHCDRPDESFHFFRIEEGKTAGGQNWSPLVGSVLCYACYQRFKSKGSLERTLKRPLVASARRCTYEHCEKPDESRCFYQIEEGKALGGRDWSSLVGSVLCDACYDRFRSRGTLQRSRNRAHSESAKRCMNGHCLQPDKSSQFYYIDEEGTAAGGQDWSSLAGKVLCQACYYLFKRKGTLERTRTYNRVRAKTQKRCTYEHCDNPHESRHFFQIEEGRTSGGQDWSPLVGSVLCQPCYNRFLRRGTLEKHPNRPLAASARRCTYEHCDKPGESRQFFHIEEGRASGGQDWSPLVGSVLCKACYRRFKVKGTLCRSLNAPLVGSINRCTYEHCNRPDKSRQFFKIEEGRASGGQDWSSLVGRVLCRTCHDRFRSTGALKRTVGKALNVKKEPISEPARLCSYEHCDKPDKTGSFFQVNKAAGEAGRDSFSRAWLCEPCYGIVHQFASAASVIGFVDRDSNEGFCGAKAVAVAVAVSVEVASTSDGKRLHRAPKQQKPMASKAPDVGASVIGGGGSSSKGVVQAEAKCVICMEEERQMCIVPCGHFGLCKTCGEAGKEMGFDQKRPFCPVCRMDMLAPWVMDRAAWEEGGGAVIDA